MGMQTCLHGSGEKCLPKSTGTEQASLGVHNPKHHLQARITLHTVTVPMSKVHKSSKQYLEDSVFGRTRLLLVQPGGATRSFCIFSVFTSSLTLGLFFLIET